MSSEHGEKLKPQKEAVIFLVYDKNKNSVWLEERLKPNSGYFGYTIIPGGGVESYDTSTEVTVYREAKEELNINVTHLVYLGSAIDASFSGDGIKKNHMYLVDEFEGKVVCQEPEKARIFEVPISEAEQYLEIASSQLVLMKAIEKLKL